MLKHYLLRQTFPGTMQWLVISDSQNQDPYKQIWGHFGLMVDNRFQKSALHMLPYEKELVGAKSLAQNLWYGLTRAEGEIIFICEDDDWYGPEHLKDCVLRLAQDGIQATGTIWQKYYHLPSLSHRTFKNVGSALCSTAFHRDLIPKMIDAARWCGERDRKGIDRRFWDSLPPECKDIFDPEKDQVIGMKGLPGRFGIGIGHQPRGFTIDEDAKLLREWVGKDADTYLKLRSMHNEESP